VSFLRLVKRSIEHSQRVSTRLSLGCSSSTIPLLPLPEIDYSKLSPAQLQKALEDYHRHVGAESNSCVVYPVG
jgi:hypothetical protein